ncbi:MAG: RNA polymerase sigma factor [Polyangiaceae bacterium]
MTVRQLALSYEPSGAVQTEPLVERLQRGDVSAVGEAYDAHHDAVRAFARRMLGDATVAEDLVHDVFVRLPSAIQGFRGESSLRTFLIAIAVNRVRRFVRAAARQRAAMERFAQQPVRQSEDPEEHARRRELADALARALESLPLDQRVAFVLCEVEQRSSREVSQIVGAPEGTVRTRLFHAKKKLRQCLVQEGVR